MLANCSLPLGGAGRGAGRGWHRLTGRGALLEVMEYPVHQGGILDAGNDLDGAAALVTGLDVT